MKSVPFFLSQKSLHPTVCYLLRKSLLIAFGYTYSLDDIILYCMHKKMALFFQ